MFKRLALAIVATTFTAISYADCTKIEAAKFVKGDFNRDGAVTPLDLNLTAVTINTILNSNVAPSAEQLSALDANNDNALTPMDVLIWGNRIMPILNNSGVPEGCSASDLQQLRAFALISDKAGVPSSQRRSAVYGAAYYRYAWKASMGKAPYELPLAFDINQNGVIDNNDLIKIWYAIDMK